MSVQTPPIGTKPKDKPIMTQRIFIPAPVIDDTAAGKAPRYARLITEYCGWDEKYAQAAEELTRQLADMHPRMFIDNADKVSNSRAVRPVSSISRLLPLNSRCLPSTRTVLCARWRRLRNWPLRVRLFERF